MTQQDVRLVSLSPEKRKLFELMLKKKKQYQPFSLLSEQDKERLPTDIEDAFPLGTVQLGMLYHMNKRRKSDTPPDYHNVATFIFKVEEAFDLAVMQKAVDTLLAQEPMLRTSFDLNAFSQPLQLVHKHAELNVGYEDLRHIDETQQKAIMHEWIDRENFKLIDIKKPSLIKLYIHLFSDVRFAFSIIEPHSISDGWSTHLNLIDICNLYFAFKSGSEHTLEKSPVTYAEFIQKERKTIASPEAKAYWQEVMKNCAVSELPTKADDAEMAVLGQHRHDEYLPPEILEGLNKVVEKAEVPLKSVLLAAHARLVSLMTGQSRITTGLNFNGRLEAKGGINTRGMFLNILPVTLTLEGVASWIELAKQAYKAEVAVLPHRNYPLGVLQAEYGTRNLFDTAFNFLHFHSIASAGLGRSGKIECEEVIDYSKTNFDFNSVFNLHPTDSTLLEHKHDANLDRFAPSQLKEFYAFYGLILQDIGSNPDADPNRLDFLTQEKRQKLIQFDQETDSESQALLPIFKWFEQQVLETPDAIAIDDTSGNDALSYNELNNKANQLAAQLGEMKIGVGDKVSVFMPACTDVVAAILGIMKSGAAYIPLDLSLPVARVNQITTDSDTKLLIYKGTEPKGYEGQSLDITTIAHSSLRFDNPDIEVAQDSPCYVLFTSGTTGKPKGVVVPHKGVSNYINWAVKSYGISVGDKMPLFTSLGFDLTVTTLFAPLVCGAGIRVFAESDIVKTLAKLVADQQMSLVKLTPAHLSLISEMDISQSALNRFILGGEQLSSSLAAGVLSKLPPGAKIYNEYGPTEATVGCMIYQFDAATDVSAAVPIGKPIDNTRIYVLDERLHPVLEGIKGEIYIGGAGLATEYLNDSLATTTAFVNDPFYPGQKMYKTGDLARRGNDGNISFIARKDNQTKLNGYRIELGEIESYISQLSRVSNVIVLVRDINGEQQLAAHVIPTEAVDLSDVTQRQALIDEIKTYLKQRVPKYMLPNHYAFMPAFPLTENGKIDRDALRQHWGYEVRGAAFSKPKSVVEKSLLTIWQDLLKRDPISVLDNFFDIGGNSLLSFQLVVKMKDMGSFDVTVTDIFEYPTIRSMAAFITGLEEDSAIDEHHDIETQLSVEPIAVIGMAGRFPDAGDVSTFWENLKVGHESLHWYSEKELAEAGVPEELFNNENYISAGAAIDNIRTFDADYFGYTPRETQLMDPQQRLLLEVAVEALDDAGYGNAAKKRNVGVFVGVGESFYFINNLITHKEMVKTLGMEVQFGNGRDFAATRLSHKLNLDGPALTVSTACSTSLVAIHLAMTSILRNECRMAITGGAKVGQFGSEGYTYQEGGILAKDGHCRTFDADATGTRSGDGGALLVLKRLSDAIRDKDNIHGVIKGSALNNDGKYKAGYTAPSVTGQADVIRKALENAHVDPESVGYVEAHGTGTSLGDPIEVKALNRAYGKQGRQGAYLGAVKPNIGHLDAAAGVASVVKTLQVLKYGQIPPSINFERANPSIEFSNGPFTVNSELMDWPESKTPRRAGVSSFGIGGTNAHLILEQPPEQPKHADGQQFSSLVMVSARTKGALDETRKRLVSHLKQHPELSISDVAHTLRMGRTAFAWRDTQVVSSVAELEAAWRDPVTSRPAVEDVAVIFMFPGQGSQYYGAASSLYKESAHFASYFDFCADLFAHELDVDLRQFLALEDERSNEISELVNQTHYAQALLFTYSWSLGRLLMDMGIKPNGMIGHSIGEYTAASLAGVMSVEQAIRIVARRGILMNSMEPGYMVSVALGEQDLQSVLAETGTELAIINGPRACVISVSERQLSPLQDKLKNLNADFRILQTSHAFHSSMMQAAVEPLVESIDATSLKAPELPFISNLTGMQANESVSTAEYWGRHLREPVRFGDGLKCLLDAHANDTVILLEVGPGTSLSMLAHKQKGKGDVRVLSCLPHVRDNTDDYTFWLKTLGEFWKFGGQVDRESITSSAINYRVSLPSYPFQRKEYWIDAAETNDVGNEHVANPEDVENTFYRRCWQLQSVKKLASEQPAQSDVWMVLGEDSQLTNDLIATLEKQNQLVVQVRLAAQFAQNSANSFTVNSQSKTDFERLTEVLQSQSLFPHRMIHCAGVSSSLGGASSVDFDVCERVGNRSAVLALQAFTANPELGKLQVSFVTANSIQVNGCEQINPAAATTSGVALVAPQEYPGVHCQLIDLSLTTETSSQVTENYAKAIVKESLLKDKPFQVALRYQQRWISHYRKGVQAAKGASNQIRKNGVYLITGGLGKIGLTIAAELTEQYKANVVLVSRRQFPSDDQWQRYIDGAEQGDELAVKLLQVQQLLAQGAKVRLVQADVSDEQSLESAFSFAEHTYGTVNGVIHAAGQVHNSAVPLSLLNAEHFEQQYSAKIKGLLVLDKVISSREPDFIVLMSSLAAILGGLGFTAYAAANAYMDSFVAAKHLSGEDNWLSINWDGWDFEQQPSQSSGYFAVTPKQGIKALLHALCTADAPQIVHSCGNLDSRISKWVNSDIEIGKQVQTSDRPDVINDYVAPKGPVELRLVEIWQQLLGINQIGVLDSFFELGGDSLLITRVIAAIRHEFKVPDKNLSIHEFFANPTIKMLASHIVTHHSLAQIRHKELSEAGKEIEEGEL
ncbi:amino acid adenylation domain-containing protein [Rheinheimera pacifica]|uniref:Amino acid adenylation domain-containing protein n=1 Tax=Rheinheimera pacifica TaxID=173990 RepID=A0A1H6N0J6_9GAMM|nr:hybrid non-ribosomal peptide synthetase/type I polyketide synthase [Rheinheimera pacifica]SEI05577.1 amino acid adenylation domain-containing protein [Rheinheimera pacifica]